MKALLSAFPPLYLLGEKKPKLKSLHWLVPFPSFLCLHKHANQF